MCFVVQKIFPAEKLKPVIRYFGVAAGRCRVFKSGAFGNRAPQFSADGFGGEPVNFLMPGDRLNLAGWVAPN